MKVANQDQNASNNSNLYLPIICGGSSNDKCYLLNTEDSSSLPKVVGIMREQRMGAASVAVKNRSTLWLTGGHRQLENEATDKTEWINVSMALSSPESLAKGLNLPMPLAYHCLQMVSPDLAILFGGSDWNEGSESSGLSSTWTLDITSGQSIWAPREPMEMGRYKHSCGVIRDVNSSSRTRFVVAAGGSTNNVDKITDSVEFLKVYENEADNINVTWEKGPRLPTPLIEAASATTMDQAMVILAGGRGVGEDLSNYIFSLRCALGVCWWTEEETKLSFTRSSGVAVLMPPLNKDMAGFELSVCKKLIFTSILIKLFKRTFQLRLTASLICLGMAFVTQLITMSSVNTMEVIAVQVFST